MWPLPVEMGQCGSKEPALYTDILKQMVKAKGLKVSTSEVMGILQFIRKVCPWFLQRKHLCYLIQDPRKGQQSVIILIGTLCKSLHTTP